MNNNNLHKPTKGEIRLALDMVEFFYPLYKKADIKTKAEFAKDIFGLNIDTEDIIKIRPFKQILFKKVISRVEKRPNQIIVVTKKIRKR